MLLLRNRSTRYFGVLAASLLLTVIALFVFSPTVSASGYACSNWQANYWNNRDLQGNPAVMRCDEGIDFDWKGLSPDPSINVDNFSARWIRTYHFAAGTYRFSATMDDGMRVYLDGKVIIDDWQEGNLRTNEVDINLHAGPHKMVVEYFEKGGNAVAGFTWQQLSGKPMPPMYPQPKPPMYPQPMPPSAMPPSAMPPANVDYPVAEVKASYLNVRSGPGVSNSVVGVLQKNEVVYMVGRSSGGKWILVKNDHVNGWVNKYYLHTTFPFTSLPVVGSGQPIPPPPQQQYDAVVNASSLNVRSGPGVQYRAIAVIHGGTAVDVVAQNPNGWVQIVVPGAVNGWVNGAYLTFR